MSHAGRLLVATPLIGDPNFERTVVLLLAHGADGAFGLVLNRPTGTTVVEALDEWAPHTTSPAVVFFGGPVDTDAVIGLARPGPATGDRCASLAGEFGTVDLNEPPDDAGWGLAGLRLFAGSAGWTVGQLEDEIAEGAWWVVDAAPDDVLTSDPDRLWASVVRRQGGHLAWFANCPLDPSSN